MQTRSAVLLSALLVAAVGCDSSPEDTSLAESSEQMVQDVKETTQDAWDSITRSLDGTRDEAVESAQAALSDAEEKLAEMKESAGDTSNDAWSSVQSDLDDVQSQIADLKDASEDQWRDVRASLERSIRKLDAELRKLSNDHHG